MGFGEQSWGNIDLTRILSAGNMLKMKEYDHVKKCDGNKWVLQFYQQFFTTLEQTVEELAKCFLLEFGENKEFSNGRCKKGKSFNDLFDGLNCIE